MALAEEPRPAPAETYLEAATALQPLARECADEAERQRHLPVRLANAMADAGLYKIAASPTIGGSALDPISQIKIIEAISEADGAAGWNLMIGIEVVGLATAAFPQNTAADLFGAPDTILSGAFNPLGHAVAVDGGYRVSGQWPFASGCHNSQYFWGQCILHDGAGERVRDENGNALTIEVLVPREEFEIVDTWHVAGLRGSGSHDVRVADIFVPDDRITDVVHRGFYEEGPLFRMPYYSRLAYNKVGVSTGIARAALAHFKDLAMNKTPRGSTRPLAERTDAQRAVAEAETMLGAARAWVFETTDVVWQATLAGMKSTPEDRARLQLACSNAAQIACQAVTRLHSAAGATANFETSPLSRCFRDVHVVPQHIMVSPQWVEPGGRVLLGLPSGNPIL